MPGVERVGDRTVRFTHDDPETAFRGLLAILRLVESVSG
jgi:D-aminopeptidase